MKRQGESGLKMSSSLGSAIRDLVLIVVGVLIALWLENWSEERKEEERFAELYRERLWDGYLSHVIAVMPMTAQTAILRGDSVEFTEIQVRRMLADLRSRPAFEFNLKNAIRSYILIHRQQTNGLTAALGLLELLEGELN